MKNNVPVSLIFVGALGCSSLSSSSPDLASNSQAATFPAEADWVAIQQAGSGLSDVNTDGNTTGREIVGTPTDPSTYIYTDGVDFFVRLRLDADPTGSGPAVVAPFGWGIIIDTDGDFSNYEFAVFVDGTGVDEVVIAENTTPTGVGDPADIAETEHFVAAADDGVDGNVVISLAPTSISGDPDYFLDFAVPMSELAAAGLDLNGTFSFIAGTSNNGRSLNLDIAGCDGICLIADATSDPVGLDGSGGGPGGDADRDGIPNAEDLDDDNDGILDTLEGEGATDTDGDGVPDSMDLDSDNDGISDLVEGASGCLDADDNSRCDGPDTNADGVADDASALAPPDTDGDSAADFRDLDSDNDGASDLVEGGSGCADANPADSVCDGPDTNSDGLADDADVTSRPDTDGDTIDDYLDLDSDGDGRSDVFEAGSGCTDSNGNEVCDTPDSDGDGIPDSIDGSIGFGDSTPTVLPDADNVDGPDLVDLDSNNDGILDNVASGCEDLAPADGICDDGDSDGDGIVDELDGSPDFGIGSDWDGDGVDDSIDLDDDGDGILDVDEGDGSVDTDGDSVPDSFDLDSDNDGISDSEEAGHDTTDDGFGVDCPGGVGNNGVCDALETSADSGTSNYDVRDTDLDSVPDFQDLDSDNDTIGDAFESGFACLDTAEPSAVCDGPDSDGDGIVDGEDSTDGFGSGFASVPRDSDGDSIRDYRDSDADGDGIYDIVENDRGNLDSDGDGAADQGDSDGDGIGDAVDGLDGFGGGRAPLDTDGDMMPDYRDTDSDDDGVSDDVEGGDDPSNPPDSDGDGEPDFQDADSDDDGIGDGDDNCRVDANSDQADLDDNGVGSVCQTTAEFGIQGGGCSTGGTTTGAAGLLFVTFLLLGLGRRRRQGLPTRALLLLTGCVMIFASVGEAQAQLEIETDYPVERLRLSSDSEGIMDVEWGAVTGHKIIDLGLWLGWADDPLNAYVDDGSGRDRTGSLVSGRLAGNLLGSIGLWERVQLGVEIPLILYQSDTLSDQMAGVSEPTSFGMGDLRLVPKVGLLRQDEYGVNLGLTVGFTLPTSSSDDYFGESVSFVPELLVSRSFSTGVRLAANVAYVVRERIEVADLVVDDEIAAKAGVGYRFEEMGGPPLEIDLTYSLATGADDLFGSFNRNYSEVKGGAAYTLQESLSVFAATGVGVAEGFGTPDWRLFAGVRFRQELHESEEVADFIQFVADESDRDDDGLLDADDACPDEPENLNGYEDADGCPDDPDSDGDGLVDSADQCVSEPEDDDAFQDEDGCPDPDNDADGVLDADDRCVNEPGIVEMQGCPDPDRDGDTVVDRLDNCPDEAGTVEFKGCNKAQLVDLSGGSIAILDVVHFKVNKAKILKASFPLLDNVAEVIAGHPELAKIRIEGHTDSQGKPDKNQQLSQRRAESVVAYLVKKGVPKDRLEASGFGADRPLDTNDTKEGRAANRRVEFKIVGAAEGSIDVKHSGPTSDTIEK